MGDLGLRMRNELVELVKFSNNFLVKLCCILLPLCLNLMETSSLSFFEILSSSCTNSDFRSPSLLSKYVLNNSNVSTKSLFSLRTGESSLGLSSLAGGLVSDILRSKILRTLLHRKRTSNDKIPNTNKQPILLARNS